MSNLIPILKGAGIDEYTIKEIEEIIAQNDSLIKETAKLVI